MLQQHYIFSWYLAQVNQEVTNLFLNSLDGKVELVTLDGNIAIVCELTLSDEEVEHGEDDGVSAEHVISTRLHSGQSHAKTTPYGHGTLQLRPHVTVYLTRTEIQRETAYYDKEFIFNRVCS